MSDHHDHLKHLEKMFGTDDPHIRDQHALRPSVNITGTSAKTIIAQTQKQAIGADDNAYATPTQPVRSDFSRKLKTGQHFAAKGRPVEWT